MARPRLGLLAAGIVVALPSLVGGCVGQEGRDPAPALTSGSPRPTPHRVMGTGALGSPLDASTPDDSSVSAVPEEPSKPAEEERAAPPPKVVAREVTRSLDRFLASRGGRVTAMVKDLTTGRTYRYNKRLRLPTGSTSKANILMALLMRTPWHELGAQTRRDAALMIRYSDNKATDRLWLRIGGAYGLAKANRRLGLRHTTAVPGRCVDMYCWGITRTSAEDQVKLMSALLDDDGPLRPADRKRVLRLMREVIPEQKWGISAAACRGDTVALKNGWLRHVSNDRWAVVSAGLIRGHGHDYAIAVLTEDNRTAAEGIAKVEGVAARIMAAFRGERFRPGEKPRCDAASRSAAGRVPLA